MVLPFHCPFGSDPTVCYILPSFDRLIIADRSEVENKLTRFKESRRAAALKDAKTRADRRAAGARSALNRRRSPPTLLPPCQEQALRAQKRANILGEGGGGAREAGEREKQQQKRYEEERTRALENQRMEDELWARVEEQEQ